MHALQPLRLLITLVLLAACTTVLRAQPLPAARAGELRVFLDCDEGCDFDYLRAETPWLAYVRDRTAADVHVLVTRLGTGAGGEEYTLAFVGLGAYRALGDTLRVVTPPSETADLVRQRLTRTIQLGLVPYMLRTSQGSRLRLSLADMEGATVTGAPVADRWNAWVYSVGADGSVEREDRQNELEVDASVSASRITPQWKIGLSADGEFARDRFHLDDRVVTNVRESYSGGAVAVRSLGPHWGVGAQATASSSTFENTQLALRAAPAVEYSVWPYAEATRRQLTFQYSAGISSFDYREETIFDRLAETRPTQSLVAGYDVRQPWGSADATLEGANFLDDFTQYRLRVDGGIDLRIVRGLELSIGVNATLLRDQLAIVKRDATPEEILLQRRALRTDYRYEGFVGLSYTFGSIFNTVVNPRFGTGPGDIVR